MENPEEKNSNSLEEAKDIIAGAKESINSKLETGSNTWLAAFGDKVLALETNLLSAKRGELVSEEDYVIFQSRLEAVKSLLKEARLKYGEVKEELPPEEAREELLRNLNIFEKSDREFGAEYVKRMVEIISSARSSIERDIESTGNSFLAAFINQLSPIIGYLEFPEVETVLGGDRHRELISRASEIREEVKKFQHKYPDQPRRRLDNHEERKLLDMLLQLKP